MLSATDWTTFNNKQNALINPITGTGTTNYVSKFTGATSLGNSQIFDNGSFVGIGTSTSIGNDFLSIFYNSSTSRNQAINIKDTNGSANGSIFSVYRKSDDTYLGAISRNGTSDALFIYGNDHLALGTGATERLRITSSGNVGIGTTSPYSPLQVGNYTGTGGYSYGLAATFVSSFNAFYPTLFLGTTDTTSTQNKGGSIAFGGGSEAGSTPYTFAQIKGLKEVAGGGYSGYMAFYTTPAGSDANTERMRITSGGNVGIGTTSPAAKLDVAGDALINGLTIGRGGGNDNSNTALGNNALSSNSTGIYNIAVGQKANVGNNISGSTIIGTFLNTDPSGNALTDNTLAISQFNPDQAPNSIPHIYAPDKIYCPNANTITDILNIDYTLYTAVFMEYSIFSGDGSQFRAGRFTVAFKSTGTPVEKDEQTVVWNNTTLSATFIVNVISSNIATIQIRNQDNDNYYIRFTSRLLMR